MAIPVVSTSGEWELGRSQEADHYLKLAMAIPLSPDDDLFIPSFRFDISYRSGREGLIQRKLGEIEDKRQHPDEARFHYKQAEAASIQCRAYTTSELGRVQSVNELALVAVRLGDMEKFKENFIIGADGSNALDSDIRRKEVKIAWSAAMQQWPHENQLSKLAEVLVEDKSV